MSAWWSLPQAAPILLRHLGAYAELAEQDIAGMQKELRARAIATGVTAVAVLFTVMMICIGVIGATWDTSHRMAAIYWMTGVFGAVAVVAGIYGANASTKGAAPFAAVRREWEIDRVILERILSGGEDADAQEGEHHD